MIEQERFSRTALLLGNEQLKALQNSHVMLLGLGGVGSYVAESLARIGIGQMTIVDNDIVATSNINRQLPALHSTIGQKKVEVVSRRLLDISPTLKLNAVNQFYLPDDPVSIPEDCTFVADAIDTISAKIHLACVCSEKNIPLISCMGMGNRLNPTMIKIGDLFDTSGCPLSRVMRRELRKRDIKKLRCIYSVESPKIQRVPGSVSYVPSTAGLFMAYDIVNHIISN